MKCSALIGLGENVFCGFEQLNWGKSFYAVLLKGVSQNLFVDLPVPSVGAINRLEWDQFSWVRG
jgi:hypothetical protein